MEAALFAITWCLDLWVRAELGTNLLCTLLLGEQSWEDEHATSEKDARVTC